MNINIIFDWTLTCARARNIHAIIMALQSINNLIYHSTTLFFRHVLTASESIGYSYGVHKSLRVYPYTSVHAHHTLKLEISSKSLTNRTWFWQKSRGKKKTERKEHHSCIKIFIQTTERVHKINIPLLTLPWHVGGQWTVHTAMTRESYEHIHPVLTEAACTSNRTNTT